MNIFIFPNFNYIHYTDILKINSVEIISIIIIVFPNLDYIHYTDRAYAFWQNAKLGRFTKIGRGRA